MAGKYSHVTFSAQGAAHNRITSFSCPDTAKRDMSDLISECLNIQTLCEAVKHTG